LGGRAMLATMPAAQASAASAPSALMIDATNDWL
jgi:hypothetical protein